jgi:agmatine/peptidylarginine deiminase
MLKAFLSLCLFFLGLQAQPVAPVRVAAEWEPSFGTLIRWPLGIPSDLVVELARDDSLYVLVANWAQEAEAQAAFSAWGVNLDHCRFLQIPTYSHWTRDWGPHWAFDGNRVCGIIDPIFDGYPWGPGGPYLDYTRSRGYEVDNLVNQAIAVELGCPSWQFPGYLTGGNFMTDGHGIGFSLLSMLTENMAFWSHEEFLALAGEWLGLSTYNILINAEDYGLQHIDCAVKLLNEETILLKQVPEWHPDYPRLAAINDRLTTEISCYGRPYNVVRVFCDSYSGNSVAAYTNSYILNTKVFVPLFGLASDGPALETYQNAMPGYEIVGVLFGAWYYYDALHCRTREMIDREMLYIRHRPFDPEVPWQEAFTVESMILPYSGAPLVPGEALVYYREAGAGEWLTAPMAPTAPDTLTGYIPAHPAGTVLEYFVAAADQSGRSETSPRTAPAGFHSFTVTEGLGVGGGSDPVIAGYAMSPNPFSGGLTVTITLATPGFAEVAVYDLAGRHVNLLHSSAMPEGTHSVMWDGRNAAGVPSPAGTYLLLLKAGGQTRVLRALHLP